MKSSELSNAYVTSSAASLPDRLIRNGRPIDNSFDSKEELYYRCAEQNVKNAQLLPPAIHIPCCSVNRQKYSEPGDVLIGHSGMRVAKFLAGDLPDPVELDGKKFHFQLVHDPLDQNYSHSEIRTHRDGAYNKNWRYRAQEVALQIILAEKAIVLPESN